MELVEQKLVKWARIALLVKNGQIHVLFYFFKSLICFAFASKPFTVIILISVKKKKSPELVQIYSANCIFFS